MMESQGFFVAGGTLRRDARSYVTRAADEQLFTALQAGHFAYVLTSRQMGKSSLMIRTFSRLKAGGATVAVLDLTAFGQNLTVEQWYTGMIMKLGSQLDLEDELDDYWLDHARIPPIQRFTAAMLEVVLKCRTGPVVIFIDELDVVLSLPFPIDEFFAALRELYNRRTEEEICRRLTFCLLGVATPSDLIRDKRTTPFNIAVRVELVDFTATEAQGMLEGLERSPQVAVELLGRVLYWTHGHPYLTQRLCQALSETPGPPRVESPIPTSATVDALVERIFLGIRSRAEDDNLVFVRERLLAPGVDRAAMLDLYLKVWRGKRVHYDETSPLATVMRLSGVARLEGTRLAVRNRLYARAFDAAWVRTNMPDAEVQRQRAAFRRGLLQATGVALLVLTALVALLVWALQERSRAEIQTQRAAEEAVRAQQAQGQAERSEAEAKAQTARADTSRQTAEGAGKRAQEEARRADAEAGRARFEAERSQASERQARASASAALASEARAQASAAEARAQTGRARDFLRMAAYHELLAQDPTLALAFLREVEAPDTVPRWRESALEVVEEPVARAVFGLEGARIYAGAVREDGRGVAVIGEDQRIRVWTAGVAGGSGTLRSVQDDWHRLADVAFSPSGDALAVASPEGVWWVPERSAVPRLLRIDNPLGMALLLPRRSPRGSPRLSPHGEWLTTISSLGEIVLTSPQDGEVAQLGSPLPGLSAVTYSPDGVWVAGASTSGQVRLWSATGSATSRVLVERPSRVDQLIFDENSSHLAALFREGAVVVVPVQAEGQPVLNLPEETALTGIRITAIGVAMTLRPGEAGPFALLLGRSNGQTSRWTPGGTEPGDTEPGDTEPGDTEPGDTETLLTQEPQNGAVTAVGRWGPDRQYAAAQDGSLRIFSGNGSRQPYQSFRGHRGSIERVRTDAHGILLLTLSRDGTARAWPVQTPGERLREEGIQPQQMPNWALRTVLEDAAHICLPPPIRQKYLAEDAALAMATYDTCDAAK